MRGMEARPGRGPSVRGRGERDEVVVVWWRRSRGKVPGNELRADSRVRGIRGETVLHQVCAGELQREGDQVSQCPYFGCGKLRASDSRLVRTSSLRGTEPRRKSQSRPP